VPNRTSKLPRHTSSKTWLYNQTATHLTLTLAQGKEYFSLRPEIKVGTFGCHFSRNQSIEPDFNDGHFTMLSKFQTQSSMYFMRIRELASCFRGYPTT
jgi:hypothetical protein